MSDNKNIIEKLNIIDDLEKQRKDIKSIYIAAVTVLIGGFGFYFLNTFIFVYGNHLNGIFAPYMFYFVFGGFIGLSIWARNLKKRYAKMFKKYIIEDSLKSVFTDLTFDVDDGLSESVIAETGMMRMGNRYSSDDYISGRYKDVPFEQSDVLIQEHTQSGRYSSTVTYFKGRWMVFRFNKNFVCDLEVREKGFNYAKKTGGLFDDRTDKMQKIELEDSEFNSAFTVYAVNEEEAYYILTPQMMRKILELKQNTRGTLLLCFVDNRLHVACNTGTNAFEPPVWNKIDIEQIMNIANDEISLITRFVDELNLNVGLFKK